MNPQARQITKRTIPETKQNQAKPHGRCPSYKTSEISKDVLSVSTYYESTTVIARTLREIKIACAISSLLTVCSQIHPRFPQRSSQKASRNRRISSKWPPRTTQKPLVSLTRNMMHTRGGPWSPARRFFRDFGAAEVPPGALLLRTGRRG